MLPQELALAAILAARPESGTVSDWQGVGAYVELRRSRLQRINLVSIMQGLPGYAPVKVRMKIQFNLAEKTAPERFLGTRIRASALREDLELLLSKHAGIVLDFGGVEATQSFIDELIGVLVLERGPEIVEQLVFRSCSDDVKAIINFVLSDRIEQYRQRVPAH